MRKLFHGIGFRLSLSHLAVILLAMGLSAFLTLSFVKDYFRDASKESLLAQAQITAQSLIPSAAASDPEDESWWATQNVVQQQHFSNSITLNASNLSSDEGDEMNWISLEDASLQLSIQLGTRIRILNSSGVVRWDSAQEQQGADLHAESLVAQALAGETATRAEKSGEDTLHLVLPVMQDGQVTGVVYLSQPLSDVNAVLGDLRTRLIFSAGIALALSAIVALLLSRAISHPLRRLTRAARAVAHGDLDQTVPAASRDELGQLSRTFNDMTARLKSARQMQIDFVADISHESRTPLTSIKGMAETLRDGAVNDPEVRDRFLKTIEDEAGRLTRLVNDLLLLSQADSAALDLHPRSTDLIGWISDIIDQMTYLSQRRGIALALDTPSDLPPALIDPDRMEQVMVNLIDNAIKYSFSGATVTIRLSAISGHQIRVEISDEGIGIPADELSRIGQRFYRADKARSRADGGTGLGLAIARAILKAHGSELIIRSEEDKGTTVSFTLPSD